MTVTAMRLCPRVLLFLACALAAGAVLAQELSQEYVRGYAQGILDQRFNDYGLKALDGAKPGQILLRTEQCLIGKQQRAVSQALLGSIVQKLDWDMACASVPVTAKGAPTAAPDSEKKVVVEALPPGPVFQPLLADPREPRFSLAYQRHSFEGNHFNAADVDAGTDFGLAEGDYRGGRYQIGIKGAVFALFNLDAKSKDLVNADYVVGFPVTWRHGPWSARAQLYHQSSHLGDEFLLGNPGVNRVNLSYEVVDALVSHDWKFLRLYGGGGYVVHSEPHLKNGLAHAGYEFKIGTLLDSVDVSLGADFKATEEQDWNVNQSYRAGFTLTHSERQLAFLLEYYHGYSPNGQFFTDRLEYYGAGFVFGL